jgi:hypothetical protein
LPWLSVLATAPALVHRSGLLRPQQRKRRWAPSARASPSTFRALRGPPAGMRWAHACLSPCGHGPYLGACFPGGGTEGCRCYSVLNIVHPVRPQEGHQMCGAAPAQRHDSTKDQPTPARHVVGVTGTAIGRCGGGYTPYACTSTTQGNNWFTRLARLQHGRRWQAALIVGASPDLAAALNPNFEPSFALLPRGANDTSLCVACGGTLFAGTGLPAAACPPQVLLVRPARPLGRCHIVCTICTLPPCIYTARLLQFVWR